MKPNLAQCIEILLTVREKESVIRRPFVQSGGVSVVETNGDTADHGDMVPRSSSEPTGT